MSTGQAIRRSFFCGLPDDEGQPNLLPLRVDPSDWMLRVRSAAGALLERGFRKCYLVLDDQPPVGRCHVIHLNETLPRLMDELGASFVNLHGWDKYRAPLGEVLGWQNFFIERSSRDYLWKFALHPGLWDLSAFADILDALLRNPDKKEHTCWRFERRAGAADFELPARLLDSAYRVCGAAMSARPARRWYAIFRHAELFSFDVFRFFIRLLAGQKARDRFDSSYLGVYHYYDGPYPIFWSGIVKKGRLNPDLIFYLRWRRQRAQREELEHRFQSFSVSA